MPAVSQFHTEGPPTAPAAADRVSVFAAAWAGVRRWWPLAGLVGIVLGAGAGGIYYTTQPQKYTVTTTLLIAQSESKLFTERGDDDRVRTDEYRRAQAAFLKNRPVLQEALKAKKVADLPTLQAQADPVGWLEGELKTGISDGGLLRVSLTGEVPDDLAALLNAVTAAYLLVVVDAEKNERLAKIDELDKVLATVEDRLRGQREVLRRLAETLRTSDTQALTVKQQTALQEYASLRRELLTLDTQLRAARAELETLRGKAEALKTEPLPESAVADALAADREVQRADAEVQSIRTQLDASSKSVTPESSILKKPKAELKAAEERLLTARDQQREPTIKRLRESLVLQNANAIRQTESHIQVLSRQREALQQDVARLGAEAEKIGINSFELELKRAEIAEADAIVKRLRGDKERLTIEMQTYKRRVNVLYPAEAAAAKPAASKAMTAAGLGAGGLFVGVFGVGYLESRRRRLVHAHDVSRTLRVTTIGTLPYVAGLDEAYLPDVWSDRYGLLGAVLIESVNDVRAMLLHGDGVAHPRTVMLTSATQGEGKTTLACLLALSVAHTGVRTLLVDTDLRNPRAHEKLGLPPGPGLAEVLRGEAAVASVVREVPGTGLSVLTAGRACSRLIHGLSAETIRAVLAGLREQYDFIVIDSCPVTPVSDSLVTGKSADAAVLVVRSGVSREPAVVEALTRLRAVNIPVVGGVMNGLSAGKDKARYPYTYPMPAASPAIEGGESERPKTGPVYRIGDTEYLQISG